MTAPTDFLIAALATGSNPDNWSVVSTLLSSASADISSARALEWEYQPYSRAVVKGNGLKQGLGYPRARWLFKGLRFEQRENLKDFCAALSAEVYIRTPTNETTAGARTWDDFSAILNWTESTELVGVNHVENIELVFTHLVAV